MYNSELERKRNETLHQWVKRISSKMREMSEYNHLNTLYDIVKECYNTGAREVANSAKKVRDMKWG